MEMKLHIPPELEGTAPEIRRFFDAMVYKLRKNAHKGKWEDKTLPDRRAALDRELQEMDQAIQERNSTEILLEAADVANFALIIANIAIMGERAKPAGQAHPVPDKNGKTLHEEPPDGTWEPPTIEEPCQHPADELRGDVMKDGAFNVYCGKCGTLFQKTERRGVQRLADVWEPTGVKLRLERDPYAHHDIGLSSKTNPGAPPSRTKSTAP